MPAWLLAVPLLLGGLLPTDDSTDTRWPSAGAWRLPVGDGYSILTERPVAPGPFFVLRGVEWDGRRASHQGADLGCGRSGSLVHAAASGLVVRVADHGDHGGYGTNVVLAHRLADGVLAYSVYAHLRVASVRVRAGQPVFAGQALARVGMTGRATTPHLHFEVRIALDPDERWEHAQVEDPLAFVEERLPTHRGDTTGVQPMLEWGEYASLLSAGARDEDALTHENWWRMLASAARGPAWDPSLAASRLRDALIEAGVLPAEESGRAGNSTTTWGDVARDLGRLRLIGVRTGPSPLRRNAHRDVLEQAFGSPSPTVRMATLSGRDGKPSVTEAVLLIADLGGPQPEPPKAVKRMAAKRRVVRVPAPEAAYDTLRVVPDSTVLK